MKINWISLDDNNRTPPRIIGDTIEAMELPASVTVAETDTFLAIDFSQIDDEGLAVYYFQRIGNSWHPCEWDGLTDGQRLLARTSIEIKHFNYTFGKYEDEGYYILEALIQ